MRYNIGDVFVYTIGSLSATYTDLGIEAEITNVVYEDDDFIYEAKIIKAARCKSLSMIGQMFIMYEKYIQDSGWKLKADTCNIYDKLEQILNEV